MGRPPSDTRDRILDAAVRLLRDDGAAGFSQTKVATAAGVAQGHLTYYFPSRADLLHEVAARFSADTVAEAAALAAQGHSGFELIGRLAQNTKRTRLLVGLLVEADADPKLARALDENTTNVLVALGALLERNGDDLETELVLCALWGVGLRHLQRTQCGKRGVAQHTAALLAVLERRLPALLGGAR